MTFKKTLILLVPIVLLFISCDLGKEAFTTPTNLTAVAGHEEIGLSWDAVTGADSYSLFFTTDGTAPTSASEKIIDIVATSYTHLELDPATNYVYAVCAEKDGFSESSLSTNTSAVSPEPILTLDVTFSTYTNKQVIAKLFHGNDDWTELSLIQSVAGTIDNSGHVILELGIFKLNTPGYTIFVDADNSGTLNTGDDVWGTNGSISEYSYLRYESPFTISHTIIITDWETKIPAGHSTYQDF